MELYGKIPPQVIELEEVVIGMSITYPSIFQKAAAFIRDPNYFFYKEDHQIIWEAMVTASENGHPDLIVVVNQLRKMKSIDEVGGSYAISQLATKEIHGYDFDSILMEIEDKAAKRALIKHYTEQTNSCYDDEFTYGELVGKDQKQIDEILDKTKNESDHAILKSLHETIKEIEARSNNQDKLLGMTAGLSAVDKITGGFQETDLIVIAARPGMGKTALMLHIAKANALSGKGVGVFSLEMGHKQLTTRLISSETEIDNFRLRKGKISTAEWEHLNALIGPISKSKLFIDDSASLTPRQLRAKARKWKAKHDIDMIIIDYLQLMHSDNKKNNNREQEISEISRECKKVAKELNIPVIALSQLSRSVETRGGAKRPMLSDLRESGSIEQDADMVGFIYRPEYYGIKEDADGNSTQGLAEIIWAKNRHGPADDALVYWNNKYTRFEDYNPNNFKLNDIDTDGYRDPSQPNEPSDDLPF
jgi:replicative DNA helicase